MGKDNFPVLKIRPVHLSSRPTTSFYNVYLLSLFDRVADSLLTHGCVIKIIYSYMINITVMNCYI